MNFSNIQIQTGERVMRITIDRPASLNALNTKTLEELSLAIEQAAADDEIRVVVITGAGDKAFVAGADIAEIQALDEDSVKEFGYLGHETMLKIENLGKPVIAAVNGYALGGGCELALACTLRIASDNALIGLPEITLPRLKSGFRKRFHYTEYYYDESREIVAERHKNDIQLFGYQFNQI